MICWSVPWPGGLPGSSDFPIAHLEWSMEAVQSARSGQLMLMWWMTRSSISQSSRSRILKLHTSRDCYLLCRLVSRAPQQPLRGLLSCWSVWCLDIPTFLILITLLLASLWSLARMMSRRMWARWRMGMWSSTGIFALLRCETITSSPPNFFWRTWSSQRLGADENASHGTSEISVTAFAFTLLKFLNSLHWRATLSAGLSSRNQSSPALDAPMKRGIKNRKVIDRCRTFTVHSILVYSPWVPSGCLAISRWCLTFWRTRWGWVIDPVGASSSRPMNAPCCRGSQTRPCRARSWWATLPPLKCQKVWSSSAGSHLSLPIFGSFQVRFVIQLRAIYVSMFNNFRS